MATPSPHPPSPGKAPADKKVNFEPAAPPAAPRGAAAAASTSLSEEDALHSLLAHLKKAETSVQEFNDHMALASAAQSEVKKASLALAKDLRALAPGKARRDLEERIGALRQVLPETRSFFSRVVLGRVNLKVWSAAERDRLRDEYNKFKFRTNILFVCLPILVLLAHVKLRLVWADTHWMSILHELWLLYFYTSLALRENILLVNGSNVRPWWIYHHYIAAFGTVILITWPDSPTYARFVPYWNVFLVYQGVVQMMQLFYQKRRDYTNRALGRTGRMDVSFSETLTEFPRELVLLVPFLYGSYIWQVWMGLQLLSMLVFELDPLHVHWTLYREEVQVGVTGVVALVLGLGNFITTTLTLLEKRSRQPKDKRL
jgi:hypothetical protein